MICRKCGVVYQPPQEADGMAPEYARYLVHPSGEMCNPCWGLESVELDRQDEAERQRKLNLLRLDYWQACGVPSRYFGESFETFRQELDPAAYAAVLAWADGFNPDRPWGYSWLVLYSEANGTGKTHLMAAALRRIIEQMPDVRPGYNPVRFTPAPNLMDRLALARRPQSFDDTDKHETIDEAFAELATRRLWAFDDVTKERRTYNETEMADWYRILNDRYNNRLPTLISTNVEPSELWRSIGRAAADRIREMATVVRLNGTSIRAERALERRKVRG